MSKIEQLLQQYCPDGVECKKLWEITIWDRKFNNVDKNKQNKIFRFKHISAKEMKKMEVKDGNIKLLATGKFNGWTNEEVTGTNLNQGEVISIPSGGSANIKYYKGKFVDSGNILASSIDNDIVNLKYCYYFLLTKNELIESLFIGSGVKHPNMSKVLEIQIPVPHIEIQKEIVRILDYFTEVNKKLELELEIRNSQYECYREKLLNFEHGNDVVWKELGEIVGIKHGRDYKKLGEGNIPVYGSGGIMTYVNEAVYNQPTVLIPRKGTITNIFYVDKPFWNIDTIYYTTINSNEVVPKFLYYFMKTVDLAILDTGSGRPSLTKKILNKIKVPIPYTKGKPNLEKQKEIVAILDKFDTLVNDISIGLPAEIELRKKQYEYYREKLLTFTPLEK